MALTDRACRLAGHCQLLLKLKINPDALKRRRPPSSGVEVPSPGLCSGLRGGGSSRFWELFALERASPSCGCCSCPWLYLSPFNPAQLVPVCTGVL